MSIFSQRPVSMGNLWFAVLNFIRLIYLDFGKTVRYFSIEVFDLKSRYCFPFEDSLVS